MKVVAQVSGEPVFVVELTEASACIVNVETGSVSRPMHPYALMKHLASLGDIVDEANAAKALKLAEEKGGSDAVQRSEAGA
jgi:hypothetical protein